MIKNTKLAIIGVVGNSTLLSAAMAHAINTPDTIIDNTLHNIKSNDSIGISPIEPVKSWTKAESTWHTDGIEIEWTGYEKTKENYKQPKHHNSSQGISKKKYKAKKRMSNSSRKNNR